MEKFSFPPRRGFEESSAVFSKVWVARKYCMGSEIWEGLPLWLQLLKNRCALWSYCSLYRELLVSKSLQLL